jgi:two-component system alkaline phosphatase synthesis response regulator PhoP
LKFSIVFKTISSEIYTMQDSTQPKPRILLAEDDLTLRRTVKLNFEREGWFVLEAENGEQALDLAKQNHVDAAVLDVMMPKMDGLEVCQALRVEGSTLPVLFLTAKNEGADRVEGLKAGGDDYLGKPFHLEELLLRVKLLLRNNKLAQESVDDIYTFGENCAIDFDGYQITTRTGEAKNITKREASLLRLLIARSNQVVSREEILKIVWGYSALPKTRTIDNFIVAFRKYFETDPKNPKFFTSVRGVGYRFVIQ